MMILYCFQKKRWFFVVCSIIIYTFVLLNDTIMELLVKFAFDIFEY